MLKADSDGQDVAQIILTFFTISFNLGIPLPLCWLCYWIIIVSFKTYLFNEFKQFILSDSPLDALQTDWVGCDNTLDAWIIEEILLVSEEMLVDRSLDMILDNNRFLFFISLSLDLTILLKINSVIKIYENKKKNLKFNI